MTAKKNIIFFITTCLLVGLQFIDLFLEVDDVEGEFLDFLHEEFVHLAEVGALLLNLGGGRDAGQVAVLVDVGLQFVQGHQRMVAAEYIVGPVGERHFKVFHLHAASCITVDTVANFQRTVKDCVSCNG